MKQYWLRYEYVDYPGIPHPPDDFIGPFPASELAVQFRDTYGPSVATVVDMKPADPQHVVTPGQKLDALLARY